jgi:hypothetical protein
MSNNKKNIPPFKKTPPPIIPPSTEATLPIKSISKWKGLGKGLLGAGASLATIPIMDYILEQNGIDPNSTQGIAMQKAAEYAPFALGGLPGIATGAGFEYANQVQSGNVDKAREYLMQDSSELGKSLARYALPSEENNYMGPAGLPIGLGKKLGKYTGEKLFKPEEDKGSLSPAILKPLEMFLKATSDKSPVENKKPPETKPQGTKPISDRKGGTKPTTTTIPATTSPTFETEQPITDTRAKHLSGEIKAKLPETTIGSGEIKAKLPETTIGGDKKEIEYAYFDKDNKLVKENKLPTADTTDQRYLDLARHYGFDMTEYNKYPDMYKDDIIKKKVDNAFLRGWEVKELEGRPNEFNLYQTQEDQLASMRSPDEQVRAVLKGSSEYNSLMGIKPEEKTTTTDTASTTTILPEEKTDTTGTTTQPTFETEQPVTDKRGEILSGKPIVTQPVVTKPVVTQPKSPPSTPPIPVVKQELPLPFGVKGTSQLTELPLPFGVKGTSQLPDLTGVKGFGQASKGFEQEQKFTNTRQRLQEGLIPNRPLSYPPENKFKKNKTLYS